MIERHLASELGKYIVKRGGSRVESYIRANLHGDMRYDIIYVLMRKAKEALSMSGSQNYIEKRVEGEGLLCWRYCERREILARVFLQWPGPA